MPPEPASPSRLNRLIDRAVRSVPAGTRSRIGSALPAAVRHRIGHDAGAGQAVPAAATTADVEALYRLLLGRPPDPAGYRLYRGMVANGTVTVDDLVGHFLKAPEFRQRLQADLAWSPTSLERIDLLAGYPFYVSASGGGISSDIKANRRYEPHVAGPMAAALQPGATFVDVGASIGFFTVMAGRIVGPSGRVIACEPGPQNHSLLLLNIFANDLGNVRLHRIAVSDTDEILAYSQQGDNGSISAFDGDPDALGVQELVQAQPLDSLLESSARVDVIKVDVEGAEGRVFRGGEQTLRKFRPVVFFELTPDALPPVSGLTALEMLEWLVDLGYELSVLRVDGGEAPGVEQPAAILAGIEREGADHYDVMARPSRG